MVFKVHTQFKWIVRAKFWILSAKFGSRGKIFPTVKEYKNNHLLGIKHYLNKAYLGLLFGF